MFRYYLRMNYYHPNLLTNLHMPPVSTLIYLAADENSFITTSPNATILVFFAIYGIGAALVARFLRNAAMTLSALAYACFFTLVFSYPALFMLLRGIYPRGLPRSDCSSI